MPAPTSPLPRRIPGALVALALAGAALAPLPAAASPAPLTSAVVTGADAAGAVVAAGGRVLAQLPLVGGVVAELPRGAALPAGVLAVPDRPLTVSAARAATSGPATTLRATLGLGAPRGEGAGVTVAVVDTGVADVPALRGRLTHVDVAGDGPGDQYGHGTFIAGLVAGDGAGAGPAYAGVAPGASVLDVRVARRDGTTSLTLVLRGLQAVADRGSVGVLNLSLSSQSPLPYELDPLTVALERLQERGTTVVVPAGNDGPGTATMSSPGVDPALLTAGGLDEAGTGARGDDAVASWSARGSGKEGPDLVAPGTHVVSTLAPGSTAAGAQTAAGLPAGYGAGSGTSFATAVVSGAAAALLGERDLTPDQVEGLLTRTAYRSSALRDPAAAGAGGLDLAEALTTKAKKADKVDDRADEPSGAAWEAFVAAVLDDDQAAAEAAWDRLDQAARQWAARQWAGRSWTGRSWTGRSWTGSAWTGSAWTARQWAARQWAARQWAGRSWTGDWAARQWAARQWAETDWSARQWSARQWSARQWSAQSWS